MSQIIIAECNESVDLASSDAMFHNRQMSCGLITPPGCVSEKQRSSRGD